MRVLIATGIELLDGDLASVLKDNGIDVVGDCYHRSVIHEVIKGTNADTVVISPELTGNDDFVELIFSIRKEGLRVVVLPGNKELDKTRALVKKLVPYGIYDFVYDAVTPQAILDKLLKPGNLGEVTKEMQEIDWSQSEELLDVDEENNQPNKPDTIDSNDIEPPKEITLDKQEVGKSFNKLTDSVLKNIPNISIPKLKFKVKKTEKETEQNASQEVTQQASSYNPTAIAAGGLFAVVSPWRPALAGRMAGLIVELLSGSGEEVAVFGASGHSTVSVWLDIPEPELFMSDWRVPGSQVPVLLQNITVWATDPAKALHMDIEEELWRNVNDARQTATYTVIDFAGDFELAQKAAFKEQSLVLVIVPGEDPEQKITLLWLNRVIKGREKQNIITAIDLRGVNAKQTSNFTPDLVISESGKELKAALMKDLARLLQGGKQ